MNAALITAAASIVVATVGYLATYFSSYRLERYRNQLARANMQLSKLYGPLYAMTQSNGIAYRAMCERYAPEGLFDQRTESSLRQLTPEQREVYKLWMTTVLQPTNRNARDILMNHTDLLIDGVMPLSALARFTHVAGYETVLAAWATGDESALFSLVPYPQEFTDYVAKSFRELQLRQLELLVRTTSRRSLSR
jgi:hypothetical protein